MKLRYTLFNDNNGQFWMTDGHQVALIARDYHERSEQMDAGQNAFDLAGSWESIVSNLSKGETLFSFTDFFASSPNKAEYTQESYQRAGLSETLNARPLAEVTFSNFSA